MTKPQYSKVLVAVTGIIFVAALIWCLTRDISGTYDTTMYVSAIGITGGVFGSAIVWYEKKSQAENVSKIQMQQVKDIAEIEFNIYERKVRLKKELGILEQSDIGMDEEPTMHIEEQLDKAITKAQDYQETKMDESTSEPELETYG